MRRRTRNWTTPRLLAGVHLILEVADVGCKRLDRVQVVELLQNEQKKKRKKKKEREQETTLRLFF